MLEVLHQIEDQLPKLLSAEDEWKTLFVDYEKPYVERVFRQYGDYRVMLHRIHPANEREVLFHPHPWPSAVKILSGTYEMKTGYGSGVEFPPVGMTVILSEGSEYEMTDKDAWHSVRPLEFPSFSLMVIGKPWGREIPTAVPTLGPLEYSQKRRIMEFFKDQYGVN